MKRSKMSFTTRYVLMVGLFLFVANVLLGLIILRQSEGAMRSLIDKDMLDVANCAAGLLDGDALSAFTEADVGGEVYQDIIKKLTVFKENVDIHFIYTVKQVGEDRFAFIVDQDPVDPGQYGEEIVVTDAVISAGKGVPMVDNAPAADRWGNFYSAYSPVYDSLGNVAGVVGIDFDAEWYQEQVWRHSLSTALFTLLTVTVGGLVVFLITHRVRARFNAMDESLSRLSSGMDQLMAEVGSKSGQSFQTPPESSEDEIERLENKIGVMLREMGVYLEHLHRQAYTDSLTRVGNSAAYHEVAQALEAAMPDAAFSVALFDVNSLKNINDNLGHEYGDLVITGAAEAIASAFGSESTYRIGGDEFAVVKAAITDQDMAAVDAAVSQFNAAETGVTLAISKGVAHYRPGRDAAFREVFARADQIMYNDKKAYYETIGDRRARHAPGS